MNLQPEQQQQQEILERFRFAGELLEALHEPGALLRPDGHILRANAALRRRVGTDLQGRNLAELVRAGRDPLRKYLVRCSGSRHPFLGAITLADGTHFTARGSLVKIDGDSLVLLRLSEPDDRFVRLTATIKELNVLLRQREHEKAQLQEALSDRQLLHRELQHRVKNNMQMLAALLHAAKADQADDAAKAAIDEALQRFVTVAAAHQSLYQLDSLSSIPAAPLLTGIAESALRSSARDVDFRVDIADVQLPNDASTPIALIVNELVTNTLKHARPSGDRLSLELRLTRSGDVAELVVADNGTGFHAPTAWKRSSGLGLVRGLVRQLRGKLSTEQGAGTRFIVSFPLGKSSELETGA